MARGHDQRSWVWVFIPIFAALATPIDLAQAQTCIGDCDGDGQVTINELIVTVDIALGGRPVSDCAGIDGGQGTVTVDRVIAAVNSALCDCQPCPAPAASPTPTATAEIGTPTPAESVWHVDNYEVGHSDCAGPIEEAVKNGDGFESEYIVRRFDDSVEIDDEHGSVLQGTVDPDGTVHVPFTTHGSFATCDYRVDVDASADLDESPTTATYDADVNLSGFCLGFDDCSMRITSRWTQVSGE